MGLCVQKIKRQSYKLRALERFCPVVPKLPLPLPRGRSPAPERGSEPPNFPEQGPVSPVLNQQVSAGVAASVAPQTAGTMQQSVSVHKEFSVTAQVARGGRGNMSPIRPVFSSQSSPTLVSNSPLLSRSAQGLSAPSGGMLGCSIQVPAHMHVAVR